MVMASFTEMIKKLIMTYQNSKCYQFWGEVLEEWSIKFKIVGIRFSHLRRLSFLMMWM